MFEKKQEEGPQAAPQQGISTEQLLQFAAELRKPDAEEQARRDDLKARKQAKRDAFIAERKDWERQAKYKYVWCIDGSRHFKSHPYENQHTIRGQVNNDGLMHPICMKCQTEFPPFKPPQQILSGAELGDIGNLTTDMIEQWAKDSGIDVLPYRFEKPKQEAVAV